MTTDLPLWQKLSGLTPDNEANLTVEQRDAAIATLLDHAEGAMRAEIERGHAAPLNRRTIFWNPLERVCLWLGISRKKLSNLSRELTGLHAHELSDRILAESVPQKLNAMLEAWLKPQLERTAGVSPASSSAENSGGQDARGTNPYATGAGGPDSSAIGVAQRHPTSSGASTNPDDLPAAAREKLITQLHKEFKRTRRGIFSTSHAAKLGFLNSARLKRACVIQFQKSLDELEFEVIANIVQNFFETHPDAECLFAVDCKSKPASAPAQSPIDARAALAEKFANAPTPEARVAAAKALVAAIDADKLPYPSDDDDGDEDLYDDEDAA